MMSPLILALALAAGPPRADDDARTLVYFGDAGPVVIRLHLRLDGRSHRARYEELIDTLFKEIDRDGDGVLSIAEMDAAPPPNALAAGPGFGRGFSLTLNLREKGGKLGRKELAAYYSGAGLKAFSVGTKPRETGVIRLDASGGMGGPRSADEVNKRLFALLDANKDGKLSRAELEAAPAVLGKLDRDEDEMVGMEELMRAVTAPPPSVPTRVLARPGMVAPAGDTGPLYVVGDGPDEALAARLKATYGEKATVDVRKPDLEAVVRLGKRGDKPAVEVLKKAERKGVTIAERGGRVVLTAGKAALDLGEASSGESYEFNFDVKGQYENAFAMADADGNGYLDAAEASRHALFGMAFTAMDRDGDGMLYLKEVFAYLDRMKALREMATASCLSLLVQEQGEGLFAMLDADGDGRLSVRELRAAAKLLDRLDADKDGSLAANEVPRQHRGSFERGALGLGANGARAVVVFAGGMTPPPPPRRAKGPAWFVRMDRNGDGDVSRKEFLGTDEQFRAIDADGDGLISAAEAEAYEKRR